VSIESLVAAGFDAALAEQRRLAAPAQRLAELSNRLEQIRDDSSRLETEALGQLVLTTGAHRDAFWRLTSGILESRGRASAGGLLVLPTIAAELASAAPRTT